LLASGAYADRIYDENGDYVETIIEYFPGDSSILIEAAGDITISGEVNAGKNLTTTAGNIELLGSSKTIIRYSYGEMNLNAQTSLDILAGANITSESPGSTLVIGDAADTGGAVYIGGEIYGYSGINVHGGSVSDLLIDHTAHLETTEGSVNIYSKANAEIFGA